MSEDTMGHYAAYELSGGKAVPKETFTPAEAALHREISRLQSALAAETKRREEAEAKLDARTRLAPSAQESLRHARDEISLRFTEMKNGGSARAKIWVYDLEALCGGLEAQLILADTLQARVSELEGMLERVGIALGLEDDAIHMENRAAEILKDSGDLYVVTKERDALQADNARLREALAVCEDENQRYLKDKLYAEAALEKIGGMQIVETLPIIEAVLHPAGAKEEE